MDEEKVRQWLKETVVRDWLKEMVGDAVELWWIEAAAGGTFGLADCLVGLQGRWLPIELNVDEAGGGKLLKATVRPAQIRFHTRSHLSGLATAFLVGRECGGNMVRYWFVAGCEAERLQDGKVHADLCYPVYTAKSVLKALRGLSKPL